MNHQGDGRIKITFFHSLHAYQDCFRANVALGYGLSKQGKLRVMIYFS